MRWWWMQWGRVSQDGVRLCPPQPGAGATSGARATAGDFSWSSYSLYLAAPGKGPVRRGGADECVPREQLPGRRGVFGAGWNSGGGKPGGNSSRWSGAGIWREQFRQEFAGPGSTAPGAATSGGGPGGRRRPGGAAGVAGLQRLDGTRGS